ncbi:MAG: hypothetical protein E5X77_09440 [Mesorhizobium sp.]|nr:MAG: hypothetical protein E5X77_09440 [Mesorhizobium sp.]
MAGDGSLAERQEGANLKGWDRTFAQMWEITFKPELERRRAAGLIGDDFDLHLAQLLQFPGGQSKIAFNEEVRGIALMQAHRAVEKGEAVLLSDLADIERFELPDDLLDCGHFTILRAGQGWRMFFNFLSGRAKARDMLELAGQFLEAAAASGEKGHAGPAIDNLFSASELVSKAELILHQSKAARSKTHGAIASEINAWARLGNIDAAFVALFNKLGQLRPNARYSDRDHRPTVPESDSFGLVRAMIDRGLQRVARSTDRG